MVSLLAAWTNGMEMPASAETAAIWPEVFRNSRREERGGCGLFMEGESRGMIRVVSIALRRVTVF